MGKNTGEAGKSPGGAYKRPGGKPPGSGRGRTVRLQLHMGEQTTRRLGVHCSLVARDRSAVADEVLSAWLTRFGRGREIFGPVDKEDRLDIEPDINPDGA
jgi:hypothetical protein